MSTCRMVALYDYDPRESSPNVDVEVFCPLQLLLFTFVHLLCYSTTIKLTSASEQPKHEAEALSVRHICHN